MGGDADFCQGLPAVVRAGGRSVAFVGDGLVRRAGDEAGEHVDAETADEVGSALPDARAPARVEQELAGAGEVLQEVAVDLDDGSGGGDELGAVVLGVVGEGRLDGCGGHVWLLRCGDGVASLLGQAWHLSDQFSTDRSGLRRFTHLARQRHRSSR